MIVSFFGSAYESKGVTFDLAFDELVHVLEESAGIMRASSDAAKLTALMFSPAIYREGDVRSVQNALGAEIIALDLDAGDWTIFAAAAWCRTRALAHIVYTTTNCRPSHQKFRMVLPFSRRVERDEYPLAWASVSRMLPAKIDPATKDISRLSAAPHLWEGAFNRFIAEGGEPLDIDTVVTEFGPPQSPSNTLPTLIADGSHEVAQQPQVTASSGSAYALAALAGEEDRVRSSRVGERNSTLLRAAFSLGQLIAVGSLERTVVEEVLTAASSLPSGETRSVVARGIAAGLRNPRK